jgi:hypothetical protein
MWCQVKVGPGSCFFKMDASPSWPTPKHYPRDPGTAERGHLPARVKQLKDLDEHRPHSKYCT